MFIVMDGLDPAKLTFQHNGVFNASVTQTLSVGKRTAESRNWTSNNVLAAVAELMIVCPVPFPQADSKPVRLLKPKRL